MKAFEALTLIISSNMLLISLISLIVMLTKDNIKRKKIITLQCRQSDYII